MHRELALVLTVSIITLGMISLGICENFTGFSAISHTGESPGKGAESYHAPSAYSPLLITEKPESRTISRESLSKIMAESIFNSSDMERRFLAIQVPLEPKGSEPPLPPHVPGEVIVKLSEGAEFATSSTQAAGVHVQAGGVIEKDAAATLENLNRRFKAKKISPIFTLKPGTKPKLSGQITGKSRPGPDLSRIYKLQVDEDADIESVIEEYRRSELVEYAEPNYIYQVFATPGDTSFSQQWAHAKMDSEPAWDIETGNGSIVIAIIDTGVDWDHPDLAANVWNNTDEDCSEDTDLDGNGYYGDCRGYDFVDNATAEGCTDVDCEHEDNDPMDGHGHGTHCSGIAAAVSNNSVGVAGVCWNCKIMAVRAGFVHPMGGSLKEDDIAQALEYAADNNADVVSMSFGGTNSSLIQDAVDYAYSQGVVLIAASGNSDTDSEYSSYPAAYDNVIAVSATTNSDSKSSYSNYGYWVDVSAPGGEPTYQPSSAVLSTMLDDTYASWAGTSMASPHVAGLAGLILSRNPGFTQAQVRKVIKSSTDPISTDKYMGSGRINLHEALQIDSVPASNISSPSMGDVLNGTVEINGTANAINFINYTMVYGSGIYPVSWNPISSSIDVKVNERLGTWNTLGVPDGKYIIRLIVYNTGGRSEDRVLVRVLNNGTTCFNCDDCSYKINDFEDGNHFFLDNDISAYGNCVDIGRDDLVFDCNGNKISGSGDGYGIKVTGGNVSLRDCVVENFQEGIYLSGAEEANLTSNQLNNNGLGLWVTGTFIWDYNLSIDTSNTVNGRPVNYYHNLNNEVINVSGESGHLEVSYSNNVTLVDNDVYGDGIKLNSVTDSLIMDNTVTNAKSGVYIDFEGNGNNFTGSQISKDASYKYGFYFEDLYYAEHYIDQSNTVNSEPVFHFFNVGGTPGSPLTPSPQVLGEPNVSNLGKINIINGSYINISGFTASNNYFGIYVGYSDNVELSSNTVNGNYVGIFLQGLEDNMIFGNDVQDDDFLGIFSMDSANNTYAGNTVSDTQNCRFNFFGLFYLDFGGIGIADWNSTANGNNLSGNNCSGISVMGNGNVISGNTIKNNLGGIYIGGNYNNITNNQIETSGYPGFFITSFMTLYNYINQSNTVNGEPIYYFYNVNGTQDNPVSIDSLTLGGQNTSNIGKITIVDSQFLNITNSQISGNDFGLYIYGSNGTEIFQNSISGRYGIAVQLSGNLRMTRCNTTAFAHSPDPYPFNIYLYQTDDVLISENNILGSAQIHAYSYDPIELSYQNSGNFWGHTDPPYFIAGTDSSNENVTDSYPYGKADGWLDETPPILQFIEPTVPDGNHTNHNWIFVNVSSNENVSACLLAWEDTSENKSMSVVRNNEKTYCGLNVTDLDYGWYHSRVYANDSAYNWNSTKRVSIRANSPPVISNITVMPNRLLSDENMNVSASVSDEDNMSYVYLNLSSDGFYSTIEMQEENGKYKASFSPHSEEPAKFNVTITANDSLGAENRSMPVGFEILAPVSVTIGFENQTGDPLILSAKMLDPWTGFLRHETESASDFSATVPAGEWDLNLTGPFDLLFRRVNLSEDVTGTISVDDVPPTAVSIREKQTTNRIAAVETENLTFDSAALVIGYSDSVAEDRNHFRIYNCSDWDFSGRSCGTEWDVWCWCEDLEGRYDWYCREYGDSIHDKEKNRVLINVSGFSAWGAGQLNEGCGNGFIDGNEECDGTDLGGETCKSLGYDYSVGNGLECTASCLFDITNCRSYAGNGITKKLQITNFPAMIEIPQGSSEEITTEVKNTGNVNLTDVRVSADTDCSGCQVQISPSALDISPGITGNFSLTLSVEYTQSTGNYSLNLTATCDEGATYNVKSTITVEDSGLACIPGTLKCSVTGNLAECNTAGSGWTTRVVCPLGCSEGVCVTVCTPDQKRCSGNVLQKCDTAGTGWDDLRDCEHGCDATDLVCKTEALPPPPASGDRRCSGNDLQAYVDGEWITLQSCEVGCANDTCVVVAPPPVSFDFSWIILVVAVIVISAGAGFFFYTSYMREVTWEDLEHKWELIQTNALELHNNAIHFLNKKIRISGRIIQSIQDETGVMGLTLEDPTGQVLVFSNPPGPKGWVVLTGFVGQNEFGEIYVETQSFKKDWLFFLNMLNSLKINDWLKFIDIRKKVQKGV